MQLVRRNDIALTEAEAAELFASIEGKPGCLSDDELDAVAGGIEKRPCPVCKHLF